AVFALSHPRAGAMVLFRGRRGSPRRRARAAAILASAAASTFCLRSTPTFPDAVFQLPARLLRRSALTSLAAGAAVASGGVGGASAEEAGRAQLREALRRELSQAFSGGGQRPSSSDAVEGALDQLVRLNPTSRPGAIEGFAAFAAGRWRVAHAPHIGKLSGLLGSTFDPILYDLAVPVTERGGGAIQSHVGYSALGGLFQGWLSTAGRYGTEDGDATSRVEWDEAWWWDSGPAESWSEDPAESTAAPIVSALGKLGFVSAFAKFPVQYLDEDLCVFVFPLSGTRILAVRVGGPMDVWR
ncbi:unnamed protein product, partial [Prorocentrum cordatum]